MLPEVCEEEPQAGKGGDSDASEAFLKSKVMAHDALLQAMMAQAKGDDATGKSKGSDKGKCKGKGFGNAKYYYGAKKAKGQSKGKDAKGKGKNFGKSKDSGNGKGSAWDRFKEQEKALREQEIQFEASCFLLEIHLEKIETVGRYLQNRRAQLVRRRADLLRSEDEAARLWGNAQKEGASLLDAPWLNMRPKHLPPKIAKEEDLSLIHI